jgi:hypothetical protein
VVIAVSAVEMLHYAMPMMRCANSALLLTASSSIIGGYPQPFIPLDDERAE